ncbi:ABC-2 type transporter [uncultured Paludibacter sp.]|nr:ABC-2 type transporter [uncultured Paludibacter sp.]
MIKINSKTQINEPKTPPSGGWGAGLLAFVRKEFLHVFRDKRTLLVMFGVPIVQILIFGFALTNEVKNARLLVVNPNNEAQSQQLIQKIEASSYFTIKHIEPNVQNLEKYFKNGDAQAALILPEDFSAPRNEAAEIQIITDASDPNFAKIAINYLSAIIMDFINKPNATQKLPMQIKTETRMLFNPSLNGSMNFVPGVIALIMMIVCTALTSVSVVREKEFGMMEVLLVSPVRPIFVLISKTVPYFVLSVVNLIIILIMSNVVLEVPIHGNILLILVVSMLYILACLALGLLISNVTSSQAFAMMISMAGIMLPTLLLTGFLFPIENMPRFFQWLSNLVPARWFFLIFQSVMLKGRGFFDVWREMLILFVMMTVLVVISLKKFKIRLE